MLTLSLASSHLSIRFHPVAKPALPTVSSIVSIACECLGLHQLQMVFSETPNQTQSSPGQTRVVSSESPKVSRLSVPLEANILVLAYVPEDYEIDLASISSQNGCRSNRPCDGSLSARLH
jgi:hypothetical protein